MDPYSQQPATPPELPHNYLDTIAVQPTQPTMKPWLLWAIIGGVILLLVIIVIMITSGGSSSNDRLQAMLWRMNSVSEVADSSYKTIKSSELRAANSNLTTVLTGASQEATTLLPANLQKQKQPKDSKLAAYFTSLNSKLEDARLNGDFDTPYAREMAYQIGLIRSEAKRLESGAKSSLKTYLEQLDKNLESIGAEFSEFDSSNSES